MDTPKTSLVSPPSPDRTKAVLAALITAGFFFVTGWLLKWGPPPSGHDALLVLLGALVGAFGSIKDYYFGSSHQTVVRDEADALATVNREAP